MNAHTDLELNSWLLTILNGDPERRIAKAGDFLRSLAQAAMRADVSNYAILRPALLQLRLSTRSMIPRERVATARPLASRSR